MYCSTIVRRVDIGGFRAEASLLCSIARSRCSLMRSRIILTHKYPPRQVLLAIVSFHSLAKMSDFQDLRFSGSNYSAEAASPTKNSFAGRSSRTTILFRLIALMAGRDYFVLFGEALHIRQCQPQKIELHRVLFNWESW